MKKSLTQIIKEFDDQDKNIKTLIKDLLILEQTKINQNNPQWKSPLMDIIDSIVENTENNNEV